MSLFDPKLDGVTHINIYSKGRTYLGVFLSNFTECKIETPDGVFNSVEGYWYWLGTNHPNRDQLRILHGYYAKKYGREMRLGHERSDPEFLDKIKDAIRYKVMKECSIPEQKLMIANTLPYTHYYVMNENVVVPRDSQWLITHITNLAKELKSQ